jgi:hypothetical protein
MSRYSARIRQLEAKLRPGECPVCGDGRGVVIRYVNVKAGEPEPELPPELCGECGKPRKRMLWIIEEPDSYNPPEGPLTPDTARDILRIAEAEGGIGDEPTPPSVCSERYQPIELARSFQP